MGSFACSHVPTLFLGKLEALTLLKKDNELFSSRLVNESSVRFVFNVVKLPQKMNFPSRYSIC